MSANLIHSEADLQTGLAVLLANDPRLAGVVEVAGAIPLRRREGGIEGLLRIVMGQQVSTASAEAIWLRLRAAYEPFDHTKLLRARVDKLQRVGLSGAKIKTLRAVARAVADGVIDFERLASIPADEAHAIMTSVHGIGPWTTDLYLLTCLGHGDAWPAGDLALQEAARLAFDLPARPTAKDFTAMAEIWRPWRAVAARLLWSYYRVVKKREPVPI
ncbi:DNA-3-methyladenine glycosylase [Variibacter gotjawalensis]|uniref:DNA-3-methyladenine glycosylase II n=1 Tax=Variibacter gotjawalensis TaxID=1333996 RepID=A0A0S3PQ11_9BRAD|nr:DNA-3-methyladenine glycosylase [Variibacter gotjawalensis]NIK48318.1 DNA-3-methyladenine glycosylase II [Variibacter gotjawalensis]RZS50189.1 DNA-3-methyladenine glycosylase II [Variibacter gotjawalensis]BAT58020.1 DNA-3-methyladenine glycosylase [Variibacter gotjawalensis]